LWWGGSGSHDRESRDAVMEESQTGSEIWKVIDGSKKFQEQRRRW
jgi:hypothetical protein